MNAIQESFTDKLFANYEANVKYQAIENAASHNEFLQLWNVAKAM
ncbi:aminopeptidase [Streptococcus pneumoniae]|nr:aminopeptidase [Streptococcus pneumoniae]